MMTADPLNGSHIIIGSRNSLTHSRVKSICPNLLVTLVLFFTAPFAAQAKSDYSAGVDIGHGEQKIMAYRLTGQKSFGDGLNKYSSRLGGFYELSVNYWDGRDDSIYALALSPVFTFDLCQSCRYTPYLELGIGATLISDTTIDGIDLSTNFQFEDRIGIGIKTDNTRLHLRVMHYSNAGMKTPNDGLSSLMLGVTFSF